MKCHHEDYELVIHSTGEVKKMEDIDWDQMMDWMVAVNAEKLRCIYENDDILISHSFVSFPDGTSEAVLVCFTLSDGKIIRSETGATPIN